MKRIEAVYIGVCVVIWALICLAVILHNETVNEDKYQPTQQVLLRQFNNNWSQWVNWEMGKCLVKHYPHMTDAKECMMKAGIFI